MRLYYTHPAVSCGAIRPGFKKAAEFKAKNRTELWLIAYTPYQVMFSSYTNV